MRHTGLDHAMVEARVVVRCYYWSMVCPSISLAAAETAKNERGNGCSAGDQHVAEGVVGAWI